MQNYGKLIRTPPKKSYLFTFIWEKECVPDDWREGLVTKMYKKKGHKADCNNCRGITLLNVASKIFFRTLLKIHQEQAGFRPNPSCIGQINTLILKQTTE